MAAPRPRQRLSPASRPTATSAMTWSAAVRVCSAAPGRPVTPGMTWWARTGVAATITASIERARFIM